MKILQVGKFYAPQRGGMETVVQSLAEGLVELGHDVEVLCFGRTRKEVREQVGGVTVTRVPTLGTVLSQPLAPALGRALRRRAAEADVVHIHCPNPLAEYAALRVPPDVPMVCTFHADVTRQRLLLPAYRLLALRFLDRCHRVVAASREQIEHSEVLAPFAGKCLVVPFGLDATRFLVKPRLLRRSIALRREHGTFALFVGRLVGYKGLPVLLEAMQGLPFSLLIAGDGPLRGELERQIADSGLGGRVHLLGELDDAELRAHYHACRVLTLPSRTRAEAFGMVLLEAMAFGKPLVTSRLPTGVVSVNRHDANGLTVPPDDPAALRRALRRVLVNDTFANRLGSCGRMRFETEFTTEAMLAGYEAVYESAVGCNTRSYARTTPAT
ncbi:MAG: glycosyltransferase [Planctomycetes bacterium]|nr:glycosyltransferase [Planctomycetota bacterium]MCB9871772.1 glycosyltransferase [Planctomycetota bacterium]